MLAFLRGVEERSGAHKLEKKVAGCLDNAIELWHDLPMTTSHTNCDHEATPRDRAACRKDRASGIAEAIRLLDFLNEGNAFEPDKWVWYGARRFARYEGTDRIEAAKALLLHFAPSGNDLADDARRRNGYTITTDFRTIRSIIFRAAS